MKEARLISPSIRPEYDDTPRAEVGEYHFLNFLLFTCHMTHVRFGQLDMLPHVQHVTVETVYQVWGLSKLLPFTPVLFHESSLKYDLGNPPGDRERRNVLKMSIGVALCGNGPVGRVVEGGVSHEDD